MRRLMRLAKGKGRVLVTGGNGFIGSHCVDELKLRGYDVRILDVQRSRHAHAKMILGSVENVAAVNKAVCGCDYVLHLAGLLGTHELVDDSVRATRVNVIGTLNILDACRDHGARLIEVSKPNCWVNTYTITKTAAESFTEMYRREHGVEAVVVKYFNVYGPRQPIVEEVGYQKLIPTAIVHALSGRPIEIYGNGEQTMDLVHTTDVVNATLSVIEHWDACEGDVFEVGSGEETTVNDMVELVMSITGSSSPIRHIPMRKGETPDTSIKANSAPLSEKTGWHPQVELHAGIRETIAWYASEYVETILAYSRG